MPIVGHLGAAASGIYNYLIGKSVRLRSAANAYLTRTPSVAGSKTTMTWSFWVKPSLASNKCLFATALSGSQIEAIGFDNGFGHGSERLHVVSAQGTINVSVMPSRRFRDPSAWYHVVVVLDTTNATAADRLRVYVNGTRETAFDIASYPAQNYQFQYWNNTYSNTIGQMGPHYGSFQFDGYLAEVNFIDGQALDASHFGEVSAEAGVWIPKKYTGTYGTNGFYLPFNDGSSLANLTADRSGNGNNWTANNISLTAGAAYDWMDDTPSNNFAVLNAVHAGRSTISNANLTASGTTDLPTIIPDSGTWYFERGGSSQTWVPPAAFPSGSGDYNFGQRPWQSTGPTGGQKALCTKNLPTPSILNPKKHFDVVLATGANIKTTSEAVFPSNFLEWIKDRGAANNHQLIDIVRGTSAVLQSNTTAAETTYTAPSGSSVGWLWKAGGAPVTNSAGSIQSQVSANQQAGFSIVTYTGTGANATVGHGLGVAPKMVIVKGRNTSVYNWLVWHGALIGNEYLVLNGTAAKSTDSTIWNGAIPTSTVFSLGTNVTGNAGSYDFVAYCFAEIPGYSKFGSYVGNGSADGPFVYCGFRPRYVLHKRTDSAGGWYIEDAARNPRNVVNLSLQPHTSGVDYNGGGNELDFTANGFKFRTSSAEQNANGATYIFIAFAEQPFQFANAR